MTFTAWLVLAMWLAVLAGCFADWLNRRWFRAERAKWVASNDQLISMLNELKNGSAVLSLKERI